MVKKYISQMLPYREYERWLEGKKVVIHAPTGMGKTTFVLEHFLLCCMYKKKKVLILCNRRLLREQYGFDLAELFERYTEMCEYIEVKTYQEMAELLKSGMDVRYLLAGYDVIVADEVHYFYQDSDFNPYGTYVLLQGLIRAGYDKTMVFITATYNEVQPLLENAFDSCHRKLRWSEEFNGDLTNCKLEEEFVYDFSECADFSHLNCIAVEDAETIWSAIAQSSKKTIIFIDNKKYAEELKADLHNVWGVKYEDIYLLNANIMDEQASDIVIRTLAIAHRVKPKILITTSVLDNGVSIHDQDVGNIVIATESKTNFIQMIGRIRTENCESCNLYVFPQEVQYYEKRLEQYEDKLRLFNEYEKMLEIKDFNILCEGWCSNDEKGQILRNYVIITKEEFEFIQGYRNKMVSRGSGIVLALNQFAKEKIGNTFLLVKNFLKLALNDPMLVALQQFSWLGKEAEEVEILDSTFRGKLKNELRKQLLGIQGISHDEFSEIKVKIAKRYQKKLFPEMKFNGTSLENRKFQEICNSCNLDLVIVENKKEGNRYSVSKKDEKLQEKNEEVGLREVL